jgi:dienelactone hydrolase
MQLIKITTALAFATLLLTGTVRAEIKTQSIDYKHGDVVLEGYVAFDDSKAGKRPAVVIYHQWTGPSDHERSVARELAKLGYVAFVADIFGKGVRPAPPKEAAAETGKYTKDRGLLRARAKAGFDHVASLANVDASRIAVIGYCFGGTTALELGRAGLPAKSFVSLHGSLSNPAPDDARNFKAPVLVLHGAADSIVSDKEVETFLTEMRAANLDVTFASYSGAPHGFTQPGNSFRPVAAARAWQTMTNFLSETLGN